MCGITGFWRRNGANEGALRAQVVRMRDTLVHRGPDDTGDWVDATTGIALGFRRLSIIDLSPEGHQPMASASGRYMIVFNGEVYNFPELRQRLEPLGHTFRGHSDSEVILAAIEEWGVDAALKEFVGMFAFALWDRKERQLVLARDRLGIKPLYYGWMGETFLFGSELKALRAHDDFRAEVDRGSLSLYLRHKYIPAPYSIYQNIHQLMPGCLLTVDPDTSRPAPVPYWSAKEVAERGVASPFEGSEEEAVEELERLLREAVRLRMVADVPLGAFLSGGVDSSTVVALMQAQSSRPVKTFSIGFEEAGYNEATHAKAVAAHLQTDHTELYVRPSEAQDVIPRLADIYDEPFADSSQIPTYLVSALARRNVTVSLSGDGGDELFTGYPRYFFANALWKKLSAVPAPVRQGLARMIRTMDSGSYNRWFGFLQPLTGRFGRQGSLGHKAHIFAELLTHSSRESLYRRIISDWKVPGEVVVGGHEPPTVLTEKSQQPDVSTYEQAMQYFDLVGYLPNDILTKVDRASMAVSLEARVPLLDHRVVEFSWRLPAGMQIRQGEGKHLLRKVLYKYVPRALIDRPKMGFGVPIDRWLRGPLRDWAESLLEEKSLRDQGYFRPEQIREKWAEHLAGARNWEHLLWDVLMFQAWLKRWGNSRL